VPEQQLSSGWSFRGDGRLIVGMASEGARSRFVRAFRPDRTPDLAGVRRQFEIVRQLPERPLKHSTAFILAASLSVFAESPASAALISFEHQTADTVIDGSLVYPTATFTSGTGFLGIRVDGAGSLKNNPRGLDGRDSKLCTALVTVDFSSWVNQLSFYLLGDEVLFGPAGFVDVYTSESDGPFVTASLFGGERTAVRGVDRQGRSLRRASGAHAASRNDHSRPFTLFNNGGSR